MLTRIRIWILILSLMGCPAFAADLADTEVVGRLPYSNQWIYDREESFLYLSYNTSRLNGPALEVNGYQADFGSAPFAFPSIDFFTFLASFAGPESGSAARNVSIWARYSLGFMARQGNLSSRRTAIDSSLEKSNLIGFNARLGALLSYDRVHWFRPYGGFEICPFYYRNASDLPGAEQQGGNLTFGPVFGAHFPVLFGGKGSFLAEIRKSLPVGSSGQIFADSTDFSAGMGLSF